MDAQVKTRVKLHTWIAFHQRNIFYQFFNRSNQVYTDRPPKHISFPKPVRRAREVENLEV